MNCAAAESWLLASRSLSELPEPVRAHLDDCRDCSTRFTFLTRTDESVRKLAVSSQEVARQRLMDAVQRTPQRAPSTRARGDDPARVVRRVPVWAVGLAASLLLVGLLVGRWTAPQPQASAPAPPPAAPAPAAGGVGLAVAPPPALPASPAARAAQQAARVAEDSAPLSQAEAFERFAAEVRIDALNRAAAGDVDALTRLAELHDRVLKLGVARQVARLPDDQHHAATRIAAELKRAAEEVTAVAAKLPPSVADFLQPLPVSCREAADAIQRSKLPPAAREWPVPPTPLEAVAAQTIRLADANDPLTRANESVQLAAVLAQLATLLSTAGLSDDAGRVGTTIAVVLDHGVTDNLERIEATDTTGQRKEDVTRIRERASRATEILERNLAKAPPAARAGLERALSASAPAREKAKPPGKGPLWKGTNNHPGKGKGGASGWQKKP